MPADPLSSSDVLARLPELREIAEKATPGEWRARTELGQGYSKKQTWGTVYVPVPGREFGSKAIVFDVDWTEKEGSLWNAGVRGKAEDFAFVATFSPPTVLALLRIVEEQQEDLKALRKKMDVRCSLCGEPALAIYALSEGCQAFPDARVQALCIQHESSVTPVAEMTLAFDLTMDAARAEDRGERTTEERR